MKAHDYIDLHAQQHPDAEFATCTDTRVTYRQAWVAANRVAHALIACGLDSGARAAILMRNRVETVIFYLGAFKAGVVPVPINHRLTPSEWREVWEHAEARLLISDAEFTADIDAIRDDRHRSCKCIVVAGSCDGWTDFESWIADASCNPPDVSVGEDDVALQMYTSGTTGLPKSAVLTHRAVTASIAQFGRVTQLQPGERFLLIMPLFHAAGIMVMLHVISWGASLFIQSRFVPKDVVDALDRELIAVTMLAPTMLQTCLTEVSGIADRDFKDLKLIIYGASPIGVEALRGAMELFGCDFAQRYGTTETLSLTWLDPADHRLALKERPELLRSAGRPLPGVKVCVADKAGQPLSTGESGEFIASGPQLMQGYWKSDVDVGLEIGLEIGGERWLRTGDSGFVDSNGYIYICGRVKDVIVSGGENIYPQEIEAVLLEHPHICQAAVIGVPDAKWGEAVKAIVVRRDGADASAEQLIDHCRERLAGFKTPQTVDFVAELPRNSSGKVLKFKLRQPYWEGHRRDI